MSRTRNDFTKPDVLAAMLRALQEQGVDFDFAVRITRPELGTFSIHGCKTVPQVVEAICRVVDNVYENGRFRPRTSQQQGRQ